MNYERMNATFAEFNRDLAEFLKPRQCECGADAESQCVKCGAHICKRDRAAEPKFQTFLCPGCAEEKEKGAA